MLTALPSFEHFREKGGKKILSKSIMTFLVVVCVPIRVFHLQRKYSSASEITKRTCTASWVETKEDCAQSLRSLKKMEKVVPFMKKGDSITSVETSVRNKWRWECLGEIDQGWDSSADRRIYS